MKLHAKVRFESIPADGETPEIPKDTYDQIINKIRTELHRLVNRTLAMHELLNTKQGNRPWLDFYTEIETKAQNLEFDNIPYTHKNAVKDALIMGMSDKELMERALSEDPDHDTLMRWGQAREAGKEGVHDLAGGYSSTNRVENLHDMSDTEIDEMMETLSVMKLRKQGRYSGRPRRDTQTQQNNPQCRNCVTTHPPGRCPANGKECFACGGLNHFSRTEACPKFKRTVKRFHDEELPGDYTDTVTKYNDIKMISTVGRMAAKSKEVTI